MLVAWLGQYDDSHSTFKKYSGSPPAQRQAAAPWPPINSSDMCCCQLLASQPIAQDNTQGYLLLV